MISDLLALLTGLQIADTLLLVYGAGEKGGEREALALHCCYSQGLPATCHAIQVTPLSLVFPLCFILHVSSVGKIVGELSTKAASALFLLPKL